MENNSQNNLTNLDKMTLLLQKIADLSKQDLIITSDKNFIKYNDVYRILCDIKENNVDAIIRIGKDFKDAHYYRNAYINAQLLEEKDKSINQILSLSINLKNTIKNGAIDLYIPLDSNKLEEGAKDLFHYLDNENIKSNSKIMSQIRNDNIIITVNEIDTALEIINYVNTSKKLRGKIAEINPFMINYGNVGITFDGDFSYNVALAYYMAEYIDTSKKQNKLDLVNVKTFNHHLKKMLAINKYQNIIINQIISVTEGKTNIRDFINFCNYYHNTNYKFSLIKIKPHKKMIIHVNNHFLLR